MTLKARYCQALSALAAGVVVSLPLAADAQVRRAPDPTAPRLTVLVFRSPTPNAGVQAADAIRERITQDAGGRDLYVLPKNDITNTLEASGFSTTEALAPHDARALAQLLRADEYIVGDIVRDSAGMRVDARLVLTRDNSLVQPLGSYRVDRGDKAAGAISKDFRDAQKAFTHVRACETQARERKYDEALASARRGIAAYGRSTLARICMANVMKEQKAPADSILRVTQEILQLDPRSRPALTLAYDAYKTANQPQQASDALLRLVAASPGDTRLLEQVVNELAGAGQAARAVPFVDQLVRDNPGDPQYLLLQTRVKIAASDWKGALSAGEELIRSDTASATADLFSRLTNVALLDSQPQKAAQLAAQGVQKFPSNGDLLSAYADALGRSGQSQQAIEVLNRAVAANPRAPGAYAALARLRADAGQNTEALAALQQAVANGDSASNVARYALSIGQQAYRKANTSKARGDFDTAIQFLQFSDRTSPSDEAKFLLGATAFGLGQSMLPEIQRLTRGNAGEKARACTMSRSAQEAFNTAQTNLPAGGKFNPQATQQLLGALPQLSSYVDQVAKALCR